MDILSHYRMNRSIGYLMQHKATRIGLVIWIRFNDLSMSYGLLNVVDRNPAIKQLANRMPTTNDFGHINPIAPTDD
jgi:hypothetical protein